MKNIILIFLFSVVLILMLISVWEKACNRAFDLRVKQMFKCY